MISVRKGSFCEDGSRLLLAVMSAGINVDSNALDVATASSGCWVGSTDDVAGEALTRPPARAPALADETASGTIAEVG